jgi:translation elongation factor EF-Tu-like GTPase
MAAGLGFKEFTTGDVLTAADANGYLASQVVMVFADAAARTSAITSPQEGMVSYLKDTNSTEYYSGSAWVAIGGASGGMTLLHTVSMSGASTITQSGISTAYTNLFVSLRNVSTASGGDNVNVRLNGDTDNDIRRGDVFTYTSGVSSSGSTGSSVFDLSIRNSSSNSSADTLGGTIELFNYAETSGGIYGRCNSVAKDNSGNMATMNANFIYNNSAAITSISIIASSNFDQGTMLIYGVK